MKHIARLLIALTVILMIMSAPAMAVDVEREQSEALGVGEMESALPDEAAEIMDGMSVTSGIDLDSALSAIAEAVGGKLGSIVKSSLKSAASLIVIVLLCSIVSILYDDKEVPDFVPLVGALAVAAAAIGDVKSFIGLGSETLQALSDFSKALLPTLAAAASASGAATSATAKYVATAFFMDILLTVAIRVVMPLVYAYIAAVIANAALGDNALSGVASAIKWVCVSALKLILIAFTAYLSVTGVISGATDAVATRAVKTTISAALPVVGGIVSEAASTVLAGASILRNSIGVFGLIAVICVCITPFLRLGAQYLMYKLSAGLSEIMSGGRLSKLISDIGSAFGIVLGLTGAGALMMFLSIISSIRAVAGV